VLREWPQIFGSLILSDASGEDVDMLGGRTVHGINRDECKFGVSEAGNEFCLGKVVNPTCRKPRLR
jgi:hypothetical protein